MKEPDLEALGSDLSLYAARLMRSLRREVRQPVGVRVLSVLDEAGPLGITSLARVDQCSQPTMSGIVNALVERGWVRKQTDPEDARASLVSLTAAGRRTLARQRRLNGAEIAHRITAGNQHSAQDLATAVAVLRDLIDSPKAN